jgi:hypothetical protein
MKRAHLGLYRYPIPTPQFNRISSSAGVLLLNCDAVMFRLTMGDEKVFWSSIGMINKARLLCALGASHLCCQCLKLGIKLFGGVE